MWSESVNLMINGLSFVVISTSLSENLTTLPIAPLKPLGFFGGTISSADFELLSADAVECGPDSFEVQPFARIKVRTVANKLLNDCNFVLNCVLIFFFLTGVF